MKKEVKSSEIKEIALNPAYVTSEDFKTLEIQGFPVRWMREDENSDKDIFTLLIDEQQMKFLFYLDSFREYIVGGDKHIRMESNDW